MIEEVIRNDKSKSHLKGKKPMNSAFKNGVVDLKGGRPSRTGERWRPAKILQDAHPDGDIGYLESLAALGNEPDHNISPEPKWDTQDQIYINQNYSSIHSSTKNRRSMESLSNKKVKSGLKRQPATTKSPPADKAPADLPPVAKP